MEQEHWNIFHRVYECGERQAHLFHGAYSKHDIRGQRGHGADFHGKPWPTYLPRPDHEEKEEEYG